MKGKSGHTDIIFVYAETNWWRFVQSSIVVDLRKRRKQKRRLLCFVSNGQSQSSFTWALERFILQRGEVYHTIWYNFQQRPQIYRTLFSFQSTTVHDSSKKYRKREGHVKVPVIWPNRSLPVVAKHVATRATIATRVGYVQRGLDTKTSFSRRGSISAAEDDPRPSILQLTHRGAHRKRHKRYREACLQVKGIHIILQETTELSQTS